MARCFKCNSPLDGDFGMINCVQCGEINFLDESPGEAAVTSPPQKASESDEGIEMPPDTPGGEPVVGGWEPPFASPVDNNFPNPLDTPAPSPTPATVELSGSGSSEELTVPPAPKAQPLPAESIEEIANFGNQPASTTASGLLFYDLQISRIDTVELRTALLDILKDAKFKWNLEELDRKIHNGVLKLSRLSPIKASVLVKKIRHLDVEVYWSQGNIYETPAP
jgi:hypothetical protein